MGVPFSWRVVMGLPRIVVVVMACMIMLVRVFGRGCLAVLTGVLVGLWVRMGVGVAMAGRVTVPAGEQGPNQESHAGEHQHATDDLPFLGHDGVP